MKILIDFKLTGKNWVQELALIQYCYDIIIKKLLI